MNPLVRDLYKRVLVVGKDYPGVWASNTVKYQSPLLFGPMLLVLLSSRSILRRLNCRTPCWPALLDRRTMCAGLFSSGVCTSSIQLDCLGARTQISRRT